LSANTTANPYGTDKQYRNEPRERNTALFTNRVPRGKILPNLYECKNGFSCLLVGPKKEFRLKLPPQNLSVFRGVKNLPLGTQSLKRTVLYL